MEPLVYSHRYFTEYLSLFTQMQKEISPFAEHEDGCYGEVMLTIEPNRELRGKILAYGQYLEVMQPILLREQIKNILEKQIIQYSHE